MKPLFRQRAWCFTAAGFAVVLVSGCDIRIGGQSAGVTEVVKKEFSVSGIADLTLETFDGAVEIRAWDRPEVFVDVEKRAADRAGVDAIQVVTQQEGNRIAVKTLGPPRRDAITIGFAVSPSARIVASVPRRVNLVVSSGDGSIAIERVEGRIDLKTGDGPIKGAELAGELTARTGDGTIRLESIDGRADIVTEDGGVWLKGSLDLLRLRTGDGSVRVRIEDARPMAGDWEIRTLDGSLTLELPEGFNAELDATTGDGRVVLDREDSPAGDRADRHSVRTRLGSGGAVLRLRTGDGTIRVTGLQRGAVDW
ncbi:MAG: DUF4097 domain-containing protein [Vicinamibacterales bacterium]